MFGTRRERLDLVLSMVAGALAGLEKAGYVVEATSSGLSVSVGDDDLPAMLYRDHDGKWQAVVPSA